ncbi:MAG: signal peptidase I [Oscillospiraceae bacterium]
MNESNEQEITEILDEVQKAYNEKNPPIDEAAEREAITARAEMMSPDANADETEASVNTAAAQNDPNEVKKPFSDAYEWMSSLVYAVLVMLVLNLFVFRSITVDGPSMNDTLKDQDKVIATNLFYTPDYGDIVIVQADRLVNRKTMCYGEPIIKRVIGLEGDVIRFDFDKGEVYRNDELLVEDYIKDLTKLPETGTVSGVEYVVPEHCVYVMGDNRMQSCDSRDQVSVGYIDTDLILGHAILRIYPFKDFKVL